MLTEKRFYVDRPGRDLGLCSPGDVVYIDIEPGCFTDADEVRSEGTRLTAMRLTTGIYCNESSLRPVFGNSDELGKWPCPLWLADWGTIPYRSFRPFGGWTKPQLWQSSDKGIAGINLDVSFDEEGRPWADFGNYTILEPYDAWVLQHTFYGVVIGLQDAGRARYNLDMLF